MIVFRGPWWATVVGVVFWVWGSAFNLSIPLHVQTISIGGNAKYNADVIDSAGFDGAMWELRGEVLPEFARETVERNFELFAVYQNLNSDWKSILSQIEGISGNIVVPINQNLSDEELAREITDLAKLVEGDNRKVMIYPHTGHRVETSEDALKILEHVDHSGVGFVYTMPHMMMVHNSRDLAWNFKEDFRKSLPRVMAFSLCGADSSSKSWGGLIQPLYGGNFDNRNLVAQVLSMGYRGPFTLQAYGIPNPLGHMPVSVEWWGDLLDSLGQFAGCMDSTYSEYQEGYFIDIPGECQTTNVKADALGDKGRRPLMLNRNSLSRWMQGGKRLISLDGSELAEGVEEFSPGIYFLESSASKGKAFQKVIISD